MVVVTVYTFLAAGEQLVGIEVLAASRLFKNPEAPEVELQYLVPLVTAA